MEVNHLKVPLAESRRRGRHPGGRPHAHSTIGLQGDPMNEEVFNLSVRKFLKHFGVTAQREIEKSVDAALSAGKLKAPRLSRRGPGSRSRGLPTDLVIEQDITLA